MYSQKNADTLYYVSTKIFYIEQVNSSVSLSINLNCSISESLSYQQENYNSTKISLSIRDSRIDRFQVETFPLQYTDVFQLIRQFDSYIKKIGPQKMCISGVSTSISKKVDSNYRRLAFEFTQLSEAYFVNISVYDLSNSNSKTIQIPLSNWYSTYNLMCSFEKNYININANFLQVCGQKRYLEKNERMIKSLEKSINSIVELFRSFSDCFSPTSMVSPEKNEVNVINNQIDVDCSEDQVEEKSSVQDDFNNIDLDNYEFSVLEDVDVKDDKEEIYKENVSKEMSSNSFLDNILNYDITKLKQLTTSINLVGPTSDLTLFNPMGYIMGMCGVSVSGRTLLESHPSYFDLQCRVILDLKKGILNHVTTGKVGNVGICKIDSVEYSEELWELAKNVFVCLLLYSHVKSQFSSIRTSGDTSSIVNEYVRTTFMIRTILFPFVLCFDILNMDRDKLFDELWIVFSEYEKSDSLKGVREEFTLLSPNGKIDFTYESFKNLFNSCLVAFEKVEYVLFDGSTSVITSVQGVKDHIGSILKWDQEKESDNKLDKRIDLYCRCVKDMLRVDEIEKIKKNCTEYNKLALLLQSMNITGNPLKIKRIMDENEDIDRKPAIMKKFKEFKEDEEVTKSRVFNDNSIETDIEPDDDLAEMLFGQ